MTRRPHQATGFSMIEVVVALGVMSFAVLAIIGLFPLALSSNRSGMNESRSAQLVRAITGTIDSQCGTFDKIDCYGQTLDLTALKKGDAAVKLYASYDSASRPAIGAAAAANAAYTIELRFDNTPAVNGTAPPPATGKVNLIEIRVHGRDQSEGAMEFVYLARNKG